MREELAVYRQCVADFRALVARFPQLRLPANQARFSSYIRKQMNTKGDAMPPKDYRTMGEDLVNIAVRIPQSVMGEIDAHVERLRSASRWAKVGRSDALRDLILRALDSLTTPAPPVVSPQPEPTGAPAPGTNSVPPSKTTAPAQKRQEASQATEGAYDTSRYYLGKLCKRGHEWGSTGQSLLRKTNKHCAECNREQKRARDQAQKAQQETATT
jgi:hypothetical protein